MFKIQVRATNENQALHAPVILTEWQDLEERMPDFKIVEEAEDWLTDNKAHKLEAFGLEFQIVPI